MNNSQKHTNCVIKAIIVAIFMTLLLFAFCLVNNCKSYAAGQHIDAKISFAQKLVSQNNQPMDQTYTYVFESVDASPMPVEAVGDTLKFNLSGNQEFDISIPYEHAGVYKYKAYMIKPAQEKMYYTYDDSVYRIEMHIINAVGDNLEAKCIYKREIPDEKVDKASWTISLNEPIIIPSALTQTSDLVFYIAMIALIAFGGALVLYIIHRLKHRFQNVK